MNRTTLVNFSQVVDDRGDEEATQRFRNVATDSKSGELGLETTDEWDPGEVGQCRLIWLRQLLEGSFSLLAAHKSLPLFYVFSHTLQ